MRGFFTASEMTETKWFVAACDSSLLYPDLRSGGDTLERQMKIRLDKALVERGLAGSRGGAQGLGLGGRGLGGGVGGLWWQRGGWKGGARPARKPLRGGCWAKTCAT